MFITGIGETMMKHRWRALDPAAELVVPPDRSLDSRRVKRKGVRLLGKCPPMITYRFPI